MGTDVFVGYRTEGSIATANVEKSRMPVRSARRQAPSDYEGRERLRPFLRQAQSRSTGPSLFSPDREKNGCVPSPQENQHGIVRIESRNDSFEIIQVTDRCSINF